MKTIKVIDLLNKIANNEEPPEKIKRCNSIYTYCKGIDYKDEDGRYLMCNSICITYEDLNYELEIIEDKEIEIIEDKEIEIFNVNEEDKIDLTLYNATENEAKLHRLCCKLGNKINELVNEINKKKED